MLDQLVESKSNAKEARARGGYLLTTSVLVAGLFFSAGLWSLFAKDLGLSGEGFELSTIVAPLPLPENAPPAPLPKNEKPEHSANTKTETIYRQANMLRIDEASIPDKISAAPNTQKSRPNGNFLVRDGLESGIESSAVGNNGRGEKGGGSGLQTTLPTQIENVEKIIPPPPPMMKKSPAQPVEKIKTIVSGGVVNGQATSLPKPPYPAAAKAAGASGLVNVQVTIDETGKVVSAKAIDGHLLLRQAAEKAARNADFNPTLLSGKPVKVTGVIVYKFAAQ